MTDNYHQTIANLEKRIAALEEDNALMKSDLGLVHDQDRIGMFVGVLHIPPQAARLLITLMDCNGRLLNRDYIWQSLPHPNGGEDYKKLDVYVSHIRRALGFNAIATVHGVGYRITPEGRARIPVQHSLTAAA